jgi:hypothetical protein
VLAPKPTGVFARPQPKAQPVVSPRRARQNVQKAEERLPTPTAPVKRYPNLAHPTHKQAEAIVRGQQEATKGLTPAQKDYAARNGDRTSREQFEIAQRAVQKLSMDDLVKRGLREARANPERYGFRGRDSYGLAAPTVQMTPQLTRIHGKIKDGDLRTGLAMIGALAHAEDASHMVAAHEMDPRGAKKGVALLKAGVIHANPGALVSGAAALGSSAIKGAATPLADALRTAGADLDNDGHPNILRNALEDAVHFPYDAVNSGVQAVKAASGLVNELPRGVRTPVAGLLTGGLALPVGAYGDIHGGEGDTKPAEDLVKAQADGVVGALVGGHPGLAAERFVEHPLYGALEVSGAAAGVGRAIGAVGRAGLVPGVSREAFSTRRANLRSSVHGGEEIQRSYSRNAFVMGAQKLDERIQRARGLDPNVARSTKQQEAMLRRGAHEETAAAEDRRRGDLQNTVHDTHGAVAGGGEGWVEGAKRTGRAMSHDERVLRDLVGSAAEGKLGARANLRDVLDEEVQRLHDVYETQKFDMTLADRRAARAHVKRIMDYRDIVAGKHGEAAARELFDRAAALQKVADSKTDRLIELHALDKGQAQHARYRTFAVTRMKARYNPDRAPTDADRAQVEAGRAHRKAAKTTLRVATKDLGAAKEKLAAERARARGNAARRRSQVVKPGESLGANRAQSVTAYIKRVQDADPQVMARLARAERADKARVAAAETRVKAAKAARKDAKKAVANAKVLKPRKFPTGLEVSDGNGGTRKLTLADIEKAYEAEHGKGARPSFLSHVRRSTESSRFVNFRMPNGEIRRISPDAHKRTGESARSGTSPVDARGVVDSIAHSQGVISAIENFDRMVTRFGSKRSDGRMFTAAEAAEEIKARGEGYNAHTPETEWVAVNAAPSKYSPERIAEIGAEQAASRGGAPAGLISDRMKALESEDLARIAAGKEDPEARNIVLMPKVVLDEINKAQAPTTNDFAKTAQAFTNVFRGTVLPLSTKWLFGNVAEMALRLAIHHGPMAVIDVAHGRRLEAAIKAADREAYEALRARTRGGLVYGSATRMRIHRNAKMFETPGIKQGAQAAHALREGNLQSLTSRDLGLAGKIGPKMVFDAYVGFSGAVLKLNKVLEESGQSAVVGKMARREYQEFTGSWAKSVLLQGKAFKALAGGDRVQAVEWATRAAREIDKTLGKYNRFSPNMRRATQTFAPFLPWYFNAARFVYWTLPVGNPIKTALLVNAERAFDQDMETQAGSLPPGDLGANPQSKDGGITPISRYTPFGAFTGFGREYQSVLQEIVSPIWPQFTTPYTIAVFGENFAHRTLQKEDGSDATQGDRAMMALYAAFESVIPFMQITRRLREKGDTGYDDSTAFSPKGKPDTAHGRSAAERIFNPVSPTYLQTQAGKRTVPRASAPAASSPEDEFLQLGSESVQDTTSAQEQEFLQLGSTP